jgi:hypothetical protein
MSKHGRNHAEAGEKFMGGLLAELIAGANEHLPRNNRVESAAQRVCSAGD